MKRLLVAALLAFFPASAADFDVDAIAEKAAAGDVPAMKMLGLFYKKDFKTAEKWLAPAAGTGDPEAMYLLAELYDRAGKGLDDVFPLVESSAAAGCVEAQLKIAKMYQFGRKGLPADIIQARRWYDMAAAKGSQEAMRQLELIYHRKGQDQIKSQAEADQAEWLELQVKQGNSDAAFRLGRMTEKGVGVPQDYARAAELYTIAANAGIPGAQIGLARLFEKGKGVRQSDDEAVEWLSKAAKQGHVDAQRKLYSLYSFRLGKPEDGYAWLLVSLSELFPTADDLTEVSPELKSLMAAMTPAQIEEGNRLAARYAETIRKKRKKKTAKEKS